MEPRLITHTLLSHRDAPNIRILRKKPYSVFGGMSEKQGRIYILNISAACSDAGNMNKDVGSVEIFQSCGERTNNCGLQPKYKV